MAKKLIRLISLCMVFMMTLMASLQGNAYAYGRGNQYDPNSYYEWNPGANGNNGNQDTSHEGELTMKEFYTGEVNYWNNVWDIFKHPEKNNQNVAFETSNRVASKSAMAFWGYIEPTENGWYSFGVDGDSGHFAMIFNGDGALSGFNQGSYYSVSPGYNTGNQAVMGSERQSYSSNTNSAMLNGGNGKIYLGLKKNRRYPIYIEAYNYKNTDGSIGLYAYYAGNGNGNGNGKKKTSSFRIGGSSSKVKLYPADSEFGNYRYPQEKDINIDWENGIQTPDDLVGRKGYLSTRDYETEDLHSSDWKDREKLFSGEPEDRDEEEVDDIDIDDEEVGNAWGYFIPNEDGYYSLGVSQTSGHFGMLFNSMDAVSEFDGNKEFYYRQRPGYENDGALVFGNAFQEGGAYYSRSEMIDSSTRKRIFVQLKKGQAYPVYLQYYNKTEYDGSIEIFYHRKAKKYLGSGYEIVVGRSGTKIDAYPSINDFITHEKKSPNGVNIDWENANSDYDDIETGNKGELSFRRGYDPQLSGSEWTDRQKLYGKLGGRFRGTIYQLLGIPEDTRDIAWGYIEPTEDGYYSFDVEGSKTGHFGMLFNDMDAVDRFDQDKDAFYDKASGYESENAIVIGNKFEENWSNKSEMINSSNKRVYVKLEEGKKYPIYLEYFNPKNSGGTIGLDFHYKNSKESNPQGPTNLDIYNSKLNIYPSNKDFVNHEDEIPVYPMPGDLEDKPGYLNEQYFKIDQDLPPISDASKWTDKSLIYKDSRRIGEVEHSYAGMLAKGTKGDASHGYHGYLENGQTSLFTFFDWIRNDSVRARMVKKTWGYIVPEEDIDRMAIFSDDGVHMEIKEVNPETGERTLIASISDFETQVWGGAITPKLGLKAGKAYDIYIEYFNWGGDGRFILLHNGRKGEDYIETRSGGSSLYKNLIKDAHAGESLQQVGNKIRYTYGGISTNLKTIPAEWFRPSLSKIDATDLKNAIDVGNRLNDKMSETGIDGELIYGKNFDSELHEKLKSTLSKAEEIYNGRYKAYGQLDSRTVKDLFEELLTNKDKDELKSRHVDAKYQALIDGKTIGNVQDLIDAMTIITREATLDFKNSIRMTGMEAEWDGGDTYTLSWDEFKGASGYEVYFTPEGQSQAVRVDSSLISNMHLENGRLVCTYASNGYADGTFKVRASLDPQEFTIDRTGFSNEANGAGVSSSNMMKGRDGYNLDQGNSITTYYGTNIVPSVEFDIYSTDIYKPEFEISVKGNDVLTYKYPKIEVYKGTMTTVQGTNKRVLNDRVSVGAKTIIEKDEQNNLYKIRIELQNDQNQKLAKLEKGTYVVEIDTSVLTDEQTIRQVMATAKKDAWRFPYEIQNLSYNGKSVVEGLAVDAKLKWKSNAESSGSFDDANDPDVNVFENDTIQINLTNKNELPGSF